jgi:hypothetical protein
MFKNNTTRFQLDLKLTQSVIDEIVARGKVEISQNDETADAILIGEIMSFTARPIGFTGGQTTADRYNIVMVAKVVMRDRVNRRVIFTNPAYVYQEEYEVPEGSDFDAVETEALDKIAAKFARSLIATILEGF